MIEKLTFKQIAIGQIGPFNDYSATLYLMGLDEAGNVWVHDAFSNTWKPVSMEMSSEQVQF